MWVFLPYGFFSITKSIQDPTFFQVRARCQGDLENLKSVHDLDSEVLETNDSDYRWRLLATPETMKKIMLEVIDQTDYSNFKNATWMDQKSKPLYQIWSLMQSFQSRQLTFIAPSGERGLKQRAQLENIYPFSDDSEPWFYDEPEDELEEPEDEPMNQDKA